jgi:hypothetical protein
MRRLALTAAMVFAGGAAAGGTAAGAPTAPPGPPRINVEKLQPREIFPKVKLHVELIVEINRMGQVTRVRSIKPSHDQGFDAHTYGNALQAFIRTSDGQVVLGTYRLIYDYDPKTLRVRRDVALVRRGGVDPNAQGAALQMMAIARRGAIRDANRKAKGHLTPAPSPAPSVVRRLPDLPQVMHSPAH